MLNGMARNRLVLAALLLLTAAPCGPPEAPRPAGDYGLWAGEDPGTWPRIAMVNRIRYSDTNHPMAGSAFLLQ